MPGSTTLTCCVRHWAPIVATVSLLTALAAPPLGAMQAESNAEYTHQDQAPSVRAARTDATISIDGRLTEASWAAGMPVTVFTQLDPREGERVSAPTGVRILYDAEALYIGARMMDGGPIIGRLGRRDMALGDSDWFTIMLDSYHDHRTGFSFGVNPVGVKRDRTLTTPGGGLGEGDEVVADESWDAVWQVETTVTDSGWVAEMRIPFSELRFSGAEEQTWGIQLQRIIGRKRERAVFAFTPKDERGGIARYGHLMGLRGIRPGRRLDVVPYVLARSEYIDPAGNPFRSPAEYVVSAGADLLYRPTSNLTVNAAINPDFGQVEVDPAVVNLGVYETFFAEKRPFFIEGSEIFGFNSGGGGQLFYSRRIGRGPQLRPPTGAADVPRATTILGAAKLSGKTADGWSIGAIEAVTAAEDARYITATGEERGFAVEPLTNYFVGRARREMDTGRTIVGGLITAVNRRLTTDPLRGTLLSTAYAAGVDFHHAWANRSWSLSGSLSGTLVRGEPSALVAVQTASNHFFQRPDAEHLEVDSSATSLAGLAGYVALAKRAGEHWRGSVRVATTTPGFEANDLGFSYRTDRRDAQVDLSYVENDPGDVLRNWSINGIARFEGNYADQLIANWFRLSASARTLGFQAIGVLARYSMRANDDRSTRGGPLMTRPASGFLGVFFSSDPRGALTFNAQLSGTRDEFGGWSMQADPRITLNPSPRWRVEFGPSFLRSHVIKQYVGTIDDRSATATFGRRYLFAPLERTELSMDIRLDFAFTPELSLQAYIQPLLSSADYGEAASLLEPGSYRFSPYDGAVPDLDFNLRSLRGTAVLRWEWRPGSTLFLVWQQRRRDLASDIDGFDFTRDSRELFAADSDNILLLKVDYWFGL